MSLPEFYNTLSEDDKQAFLDAQGHNYIINTGVVPYPFPPPGAPVSYSSKSDKRIKDLADLAAVLDTVDENGYLPGNPAYTGDKTLPQFTVRNHDKDRSLSGKARKKARQAERKMPKTTELINKMTPEERQELIRRSNEKLPADQQIPADFFDTQKNA